ncbi:MAG: ABC transporter permease subunit, partial [Treponema sp.]|nr:ABC transporter permease subunit [Treponema sp.]
RERRLEQLQSPLFRAGMIFYFVVIFCFIGGPLLSIPVESFLFKPSRAGPPEFSLRYWTGIADSVLPSLGRSVGLAVLSASLSCGFGILAAGGLRNIGKETPGSARIIRFCMASPLVSSGIVLGLGWLRLYGRENARNIWAAALVHGLTALPFVFNSLSRGLDSLDDTALKAAEIAGAGPMLRIITVAIPCAFQRLRSAWGIAAALSLGELNAVMMLGIENWETLPLLIYRAAGSYRYGVACAAGSALILCCGAVFGISEFRFPRKKHIP